MPKYYELSVEKYPHCKYAYRVPYKLGLLYRRLEDYEQSIYWFDQQRRLYAGKPYEERALYCKGLVYLYKLKDYEKAATVFQEFIETYPSGRSVLAPYRLAACYEKLGKMVQAIELLQEGLEKFSNTVYADTYREKLMQLQ